MAGLVAFGMVGIASSIAFLSLLLLISFNVACYCMLPACFLCLSHSCTAVLCCPIFGTVGLLWRSIHTFVYPCGTVLLQRCMIGCCWRYFCCCFGWPYQDDSFVGAKALGNFDKESAKKMEKSTDWVRAQDLHQFKGKSPQLFEGGIEPSDLCQGAVGDCWLVAAFACASEFPDMIRHMFLTKEYNPRGLYKIRIFDPQLNKWVVVTVDDRIPCKKGTNRPRFMKPNGNELWAILLEKAYAKHCGSYAAMVRYVSVRYFSSFFSKETRQQQQQQRLD
jgi:hypothetical protein